MPFDNIEVGPKVQAKHMIEIPTLTIQQPWASAIMAGVKPVENRVWSPSMMVGQRFLVHAGKSTANLQADTTMDPIRVVWPECPEEFPLGCLLGIVTFAGIVRAHERPECPWSSGPLCWILTNPVALQPVPYRGARGLFRVPTSDLPREYIDAL